MMQTLEWQAPSPKSAAKVTEICIFGKISKLLLYFSSRHAMEQLVRVHSLPTSRFEVSKNLANQMYTLENSRPEPKKYRFGSNNVPFQLSEVYVPSWFSGVNQKNGPSIIFQNTFFWILAQGFNMCIGFYSPRNPEDQLSHVKHISASTWPLLPGSSFRREFNRVHLRKLGLGKKEIWVFHVKFLGCKVCLNLAWLTSVWEEKSRNVYLLHLLWHWLL